MFFSSRRKALKLLKYTILAFAVVFTVVFLALLARVYIEPPQPNVDIQANTKFDIERYLSEDISKTDNILEIKLKAEKHYPDLTLKLESEYLNFSYEDYINYTYNNSNTSVKPAGFIPPGLVLRSTVEKPILVEEDYSKTDIPCTDTISGKRPYAAVEEDDGMDTHISCSKNANHYDSAQEEGIGGGAPVHGGVDASGDFTSYHGSREEEIEKINDENISTSNNSDARAEPVDGVPWSGHTPKTPYIPFPFYSKVYDGLICVDSINDKYLIYNTSNYTGFIYDGLNNTFYSADIKLRYEHKNFTIIPNEEKTFCFPIDFSSFPKDQKSTEITIELVDNNRSNLDSSYIQITKFIKKSIPSAKIENLCNNIVDYVAARKSDKRIKTINYNFGEISTTDDIKLWFILFVPKYVDFLNMNVQIQNKIVKIFYKYATKVITYLLYIMSLFLHFLQGLVNAMMANYLLFVTFLYVIVTAAIAYLTYRSRPILMKAIEEHTLRLRELAEDWLKEIEFDELEKPLRVLKQDHFQIEKEFLFEDLKLHIPKEINMLNLWEKFKMNINDYNNLKCELYRALKDYIIKQTKLNYSSEKNITSASFNDCYIMVIYLSLTKSAKKGHIIEPNIIKKRRKSKVIKTEKEDKIWELYDSTENLLAYGDEYQINPAYEIVSTLCQDFWEFQKQKIAKESTLYKSLSRLIELEKILNEQKDELKLKINDFISIPLYTKKCKYIKMVK